MNISRTLNIAALGKKDEIKNLLNLSKKIYTKFGLIFLFKTNEDECTRAAILVKKSCGTAVQRNYIKRIIRHFLREHYFMFSKYNRIVFLYRFKGKVNFNLLKNDFIKSLKKHEKNSTFFD